MRNVLARAAVLAAASAAALVCAACTHRAPIGPATPTPDEQALIQRMTVDPFVRVLRLDRDGQGRLIITTGQGDEVIRYQAVKPADGGTRLRCERLGDHSQLEVGIDDGVIGTGADPRGLGARMPAR